METQNNPLIEYQAEAAKSKAKEEDRLAEIATKLTEAGKNVGVPLFPETTPQPPTPPVEASAPIPTDETPLVTVEDLNRMIP